MEITFTAAQVLFSSTLPPEMKRMPLVLSFLHKKHLGLVCTASGYYVTAHFGTLLPQAPLEITGEHDSMSARVESSHPTALP